MNLRRDVTEALAQEARLKILRELDKQIDSTLSDLLLQRVLEMHGFRRDRDWIVTQLRKLDSLGAVALTDNGETVFARLEPTGRDHLKERIILEGVLRPAEAE